MKSTGIVRKVDKLHRIVIPQEICNTHGIEELTPLEIFVDGDKIVLKKYNPGCTFCGSLENVDSYKGRPICLDCRVNIGAGLE